MWNLPAILEKRTAIRMCNAVCEFGTNYVLRRAKKQTDEGSEPKEGREE